MMQNQAPQYCEGLASFVGYTSSQVTRFHQGDGVEYSRKSI